MNLFDTEIAGLANKIVYSKPHLKDIFLRMKKNFENSIFAQDDKGNNILHYLAAKDEVEAFENICTQIKNIHQEIFDSRCKDSCVHLEKALNTPNYKGMTPVHIALELKHSGILELFLCYKLDLTLENAERLSSIELAVINDNAKFIKKLMGNKSFKGLLEHKIAGKTLLFIAAENGAKDCVELFCKDGNLIDINETNYPGVSPLAIAVEKGNYDVVNILIDNGADMDIVDFRKKGPLEVALDNNHDTIINLLLIKGATITEDQGIRIGYKSSKSLIYSLLSFVIDFRGSYVGLKKESPELLNLRNILVDHIKKIKFSVSSSNKFEEIVENFLNNIQSIKLHDFTSMRSKEHIIKALAPSINKFLDEVIYE